MRKRYSYRKKAKCPIKCDRTFNCIVYFIVEFFHTHTHTEIFEKVIITLIRHFYY